MYIFLDCKHAHWNLYLDRMRAVLSLSRPTFDGERAMFVSQGQTRSSRPSRLRSYEPPSLSFLSAFAAFSGNVANSSVRCFSSASLCSSFHILSVGLRASFSTMQCVSRLISQRFEFQASRAPQGWRYSTYKAESTPTTPVLSS